MRALLFLAATLLPAADLIIDHVSVSGRDLKQMQARLESIGIHSEFGGNHTNGATQMAIASFPDGSYIELIAIQPNPDQKALAEHYWSKQMQQDAGPTGWAVRSNDVSVEVARLKTAGISVSAPNQSGRKRPDGFQLAWKTARVGDEPNGTFFPFLISDASPRDARAYPTGKPSNINYTGIKQIMIAVRDLNVSIKRFRQAYALGEPIVTGRTATFFGTPIILAAPSDAQPWIAKRLERFGEGPCAFILGEQHGPAKAEWFDLEKLGWHLGHEK